MRRQADFFNAFSILFIEDVRQILCEDCLVASVGRTEPQMRNRYQNRSVLVAAFIAVALPCSLFIDLLHTATPSNSNGRPTIGVSLPLSAVVTATPAVKQSWVGYAAKQRPLKTLTVDLCVPARTMSSRCGIDIDLSQRWEPLEARRISGRAPPPV